MHLLKRRSKLLQYPKRGTEKVSKIWDKVKNTPILKSGLSVGTGAEWCFTLLCQPDRGNKGHRGWLAQTCHPHFNAWRVPSLYNALKVVKIIASAASLIYTPLLHPVARWSPPSRQPDRGNRGTRDGSPKPAIPFFHALKRPITTRGLSLPCDFLIRVFITIGLLGIGTPSYRSGPTPVGRLYEVPYPSYGCRQ